jgi:peptidoglycan/xylan/chitin deacetylase (PgdA/CDA1 family)
LGFRFISLRQVLNDPQSAWTKHDRSILLTFDDGYVNNFEYAWPVLEKMACPATFFVLAGVFGGTNVWDFPNLKDSERDRLMTREQMQAMAASPWVTFGSHGLEHRHLAQTEDHLLMSELQGSYDILSDLLGDAFLPVMAYPWGKYSDRVLETMTHTPYQMGFTTDKGVWQPNSDAYRIPRYTGYLRDGNPLILTLKLMRNRLIWPFSSQSNGPPTETLDDGLIEHAPC